MDKHKKFLGSTMNNSFLRGIEFIRYLVPGGIVPGTGKELLDERRLEGRQRQELSRVPGTRVPVP